MAEEATPEEDTYLDTPEDTDEELGSHFNANYIGDIVNETMAAIQIKLDENAARIQMLTKYFVDPYSTNGQRKMASAHLFALRKERRELTEAFDNALNVVEELHEPVTIIYT